MWRYLGFLLMIIILSFVVCLSGVCGATEVNVENKYVAVGDYFPLNITCFPTEPIKGWEFKIRFNTSMLHAVNVVDGDFFDGYQEFPVLGVIDNTNGTITDIYNLIVGKTGNVSQAGVMATINFIAIAPGSSLVRLYDVGVCNETMYIPRSLYNGTVAISGTTEDNGSGNFTPPPENETQQPEENETQPPPKENNTAPPENDNSRPASTGTQPISMDRLKEDLSNFGSLMVVLVLVNFFLFAFSRIRF